MVAMIERSDAPAAAADVARPPRREWPAYLLGSKPAAIAARVGLALDHGLEVGDDRGCLCKLARAVGALDAGERFPDRSGPRIQLVPGGPVSNSGCMSSSDTFTASASASSRMYPEGCRMPISVGGGRGTGCGGRAIDGDSG